MVSAIHAAVAGLGLALLPRILIERELLGGQLMRVGNYSAINAEKTYFLYPEQKREWTPLVTFATWLDAEIALYRNQRDRADDERPIAGIA